MSAEKAQKKKTLEVQFRARGPPEKPQRQLRNVIQHQRKGQEKRIHAENKREGVRKKTDKPSP